MVRNAKTGGTNNLPQPAMSLEEAVRFYGWEHLAPGTQQCRWYTLRRFDLLGLKPGEAEKPTLYGKHNTKRRDASILNKVFGFDFYVPNAEPHRYELPTDEQLSRALGRKHGLYTALMAYAGLRVGEACAMDRSYLKGNFIDVQDSLRDGLRRKAKTTGMVRIPNWLGEWVQKADFYYPECHNVSKSLRLDGLNPHQLRHFYATTLINTTSNLEMVRRQMRHTNIATTLRVYVEVGIELEDIDHIQPPGFAA